MAARSALLEEFGPQLGRPYADTLDGSRHANMKELRFTADDGVWRVAYAFDPDREAILLIAGGKSGKSTTRFYKRLIEQVTRSAASSRNSTVNANSPVSLHWSSAER